MAPSAARRDAMSPYKSLLSKVILWTSCGGVLIAFLLLGPTLVYAQRDQLRQDTERCFRGVYLVAPYVRDQLAAGQTPQLPPSEPGAGVHYALFDGSGQLVRFSGGERPDCLRDLRAAERCADQGHIHIKESLRAADQRLLGTLMAFHRPAPLLVSVAKGLIGPFTFILLFLIGNGMLTIWVFYRLVLTPIAQLIHADRRGLAGRGAEVLVPDSAIPQNELGHIMRSRNTLLRRMREYQQLIQEKNAVLEAQRAELMRWSRELEERISLKKRELREAQRQLVQNEKLASVGQLAAGIAHEINNPLATIAGYAEDLREQAEGELKEVAGCEDLPHGLQVIEDQVYRCKKIVQNLLNFARKSTLRIEEVDVGELVVQTVPLVEIRRSEKGCSISSEVEEVPTIATCADSLQQVLVNLLQNAIDAAGEGGEVTISARGVEGEVELEVRDNGPGIPEDIHDRIFDPFFTTKAVGTGTGLGLSICYGIVTDLKGHLSFATVPGRGSTFSVRIPDYHQSRHPEPVEAEPHDTTISFKRLDLDLSEGLASNV